MLSSLQTSSYLSRSCRNPKISSYKTTNTAQLRRPFSQITTNTTLHDTKIIDKDKVFAIEVCALSNKKRFFIKDYNNKLSIVEEQLLSSSNVDLV